MLLRHSTFISVDLIIKEVIKRKWTESQKRSFFGPIQIFWLLNFLEFFNFISLLKI